MSARRHIAAIAVLLAAGACALAACGGGSTAVAPSRAAGGTEGGVAAETNPGGDIPDNQAFVPYRDAAGLYTVTVPEGWARTSDSGAILFSDKYNSIRIESRPMAGAPTVDSVRTADLPAVQASAQGFTAGKVTSANRKSGPAILMTYRADSAPNPVTGKVAAEDVERYVFWRSGREVILTLSAPVGSDNVDPWRTVTDSFAWTS